MTGRDLLNQLQTHPELLDQEIDGIWIKPKCYEREGYRSNTCVCTGYKLSYNIGDHPLASIFNFRPRIIELFNTPIFATPKTENSIVIGVDIISPLDEPSDWFDEQIGT